MLVAPPLDVAAGTLQAQPRCASRSSRCPGMQIAEVGRYGYDMAMDQYLYIPFLGG